MPPMAAWAAWLTNIVSYLRDTGRREEDGQKQGKKKGGGAGFENDTGGEGFSVEI
jgi:hypothetical protein